MKKSKKHHAGAGCESPFIVIYSKNSDFGTQKRIQRIQRKRWQELRLRAYLTRAPGFRMTEVKTNSLKLANLVFV